MPLFQSKKLYFIGAPLSLEIFQLLIKNTEEPVTLLHDATDQVRLANILSEEDFKRVRANRIIDI